MTSAPAASSVPRLAACSPAEFHRSWVRPGRPVVVGGVASRWPAFTRWTPASLGERFRDTRVQIMRAPGGRVDSSGKGGTTYDPGTLGGYVEALASGAPDPGYLVTMWDELPQSLRDDAPWPELCGPARFQQPTLWFGPAGIVSPMHFDVPDNLYVVVHGKKRFTLIPPGDSWKVHPYALWTGRAQYAQVDPEQPEAFPRYAGAHPWVAEVSEGEALYIPPFWWHHARGLETTLAVNFWWGNGLAAALALAADGWKRVRGLSR